jgi:hypothetical protein
VRLEARNSLLAAREELERRAANIFCQKVDEFVDAAGLVW